MKKIDIKIKEQLSKKLEQRPKYILIFCLDEYRKLSKPYNTNIPIKILKSQKHLNSFSFYQRIKPRKN